MSTFCIETETRNKFVHASQNEFNKKLCALCVNGIGIYSRWLYSNFFNKYIIRCKDERLFRPERKNDNASWTLNEAHQIIVADLDRTCILFVCGVVCPSANWQRHNYSSQLTIIICRYMYLNRHLLSYRLSAWK